MQYEPIILELMSRIKVLESDVSNAKEKISYLESVVFSKETESLTQTESKLPEVNTKKSVPFTKTTEEMICACYEQGKEAYQNPSINIWSLADCVAEETGMNRNSAFMYICAVKNMLEGSVFKRAVNIKALKYYLEAICQDYGADGLRKAVFSVRQNIAYRQRFHLPSDSISAVCDEYERKLR